MSAEDIPLGEATPQSGSTSPRWRLSRDSAIYGLKTGYGRKLRWLVSTASPVHYTDPVMCPCTTFINSQ